MSIIRRLLNELDNDLDRQIARTRSAMDACEAAGHDEDETLFTLSETFAVQSTMLDNAPSVAAVYAMAIARIIALQRRMDDYGYVLRSLDAIERL